MALKIFSILLKTFRKNHKPQHRDGVNKFDHRNVCAVFYVCFFLLFFVVGNIISFSLMEMGTNQKSFWSAKKKHAHRKKVRRWRRVPLENGNSSKAKSRELKCKVKRKGEKEPNRWRTPQHRYFYFFNKSLNGFDIQMENGLLRAWLRGEKNLFNFFFDAKFGKHG